MLQYGNRLHFIVYFKSAIDHYQAQDFTKSSVHLLKGLSVFLKVPK